MPLEVRYIGTVDEDVLASPCIRLLLFNLNFYDITWVLYKEGGQSEHIEMDSMVETMNPRTILLMNVLCRLRTSRMTLSYRYTSPEIKKYFQNTPTCQ